MAKNTDKQLSRRVLALIKRDMTAHTPVVVWQHELPIIEAIYGEGHFEVLDAAKMDQGYSAKPTSDMLVYNKNQEVVPRPSDANGIGFVFIDDPRTEYERLKARYGKGPTADAEEPVLYVEHVYGRFQEGRFAALLGAPALEDLPDEQLRSLIRASGLFRPVKYEATQEEKDAATRQVADFMKATKAELLKLAADVGVEVA